MRKRGPFVVLTWALNRSVYETSGVQDLREEMVLQVRSIAQCNEVVVCATAQYWDHA